MFRIKDTVYFFLLPIIIIMILIMKILLHNEYKIINLWYPTYVYQFFNFPYNSKNKVLACFQTRPQICVQAQNHFKHQTTYRSLHFII